MRTRATSRNSRQLDRAMTVAPPQSRELIALAGGASRATSAAASPNLPIPAGSGDVASEPAQPAAGPRFLHRDGVGRHHRPRLACRHGALHRGHLAGSIGGGISGLGDASCLRARQTHSARRQGDAQGDAVQQLSAKVRRVGRQGRRTVSILCRRTIASRMKLGASFRSTSSIKAFCCSSNGGTTPRPACAAFPSSHEDMVEFASRQILDMFAPSNFPLTNPEILLRTVATGGLNLVKGFQNYMEDAERAIARQKARWGRRFRRSAATWPTTPGKVDLSQSIDRAHPIRARRAPQVRPEPILIVPAWIMKYYILDLSPHNSLVKLSHRAGLHRLHDLLEESRVRKIAISAWTTIGRSASWPRSMPSTRSLPDRKVHAVGYCLGGTLLAIAAAAMARDGDERLATVTLLGRADRLHRSRRAHAVHRREPAGVSRRHDVGAGLPRQPADGRRVPDAALERPHLVAPGARLSARRASADDRPDGVERRRDPHALPDAFGISAQAVPRQRPCRGPLRSRRPAGRA